MSITDDTAPPEWSPDQILKLIIFGTDEQRAAREEQNFQEDMAYIRSLGSALLEYAGNRLSWPAEATIWEQLKADVSPEVRRAVFGCTQSFQNLWDAA